MGHARPIGRWKMTALVINCIIGSAIFGVPSEGIRLVGNNSPRAMLLGSLLVGIIILPITEVASQFSEAGGLYLYARTAFGRFVGLQVGWFWLLAAIGGGAAGANLFLTYLSEFLPGMAHGWWRAVTILLVIAIPTTANYLGVRQGVRLSILFTAAKVLPLALVIGLGLLQKRLQPHLPAQGLSSSVGAWAQVLLIFIYALSGWEDTLVPSGEVQRPRHTIPFALVAGLLTCTFIYTSFQFVIVRVIGASPTDRPVVEAVSVLLGSGAASFVAVAVMLSTYGWISGEFLNAPRLSVALAQQGDCPPFFGKLHPRYQTPSVGILLYGATVVALALTGTFLWAIALTAGALAIYYAIACAALIELRHSQPAAPAFRVPFGSVLAVLGIVISVGLLTQLELRQLSLMSITALLAAGNWLWARAKPKQRQYSPVAVID